MPHKITRFISAYIAVTLIILAAICLYLRITPLFLGVTDFISFLALDDPIYHLRRIELISAQFPNYNWFEALTNYPGGTIIHWGPLFPLICTAFVMIMGAATRTEIVMFALLVPPLMAACMVPLSYFIGKKLLDWKAGLITALFIACIPGQYYARSFYGYLDHHIAETLFSTLFCLCYMYALWSCRDKEVNLHQLATWKIPILYGLISGFAYFLGYANMPTMLLFGLITSIFTLFWFIAERWMGKDGLYLAILNTVTFGIAILGSILIGFPAEGMGLNYYTIMNPIVLATIIIATWVLLGLSYYLQKNSILHYIGSIVVCGGIGVIVTSLLLPSFFNTMMGAARYFFSAGGIWVTIMEARPWTFDDAWGTFSYSILFFVLGLLVCSFLLYRKKHPIYCFALVWGLMILFATSGQIRYEYYLAVPISVLSGLFFGFLINTVLENISNSGGIKRALTAKNAKKKPKTALLYIALIIFGILGGMFVYDRFSEESKMTPLELNSDWRISLMWMEENTPDPGIDYYHIYDKNEWTVPDESYGVLSWWDYGHMIQYFAKRPSIANPFQQGIQYAAPFFTTGSEDDAIQVLNNTNTKYIITDVEMVSGKFWAMATWNNTAIGSDPYHRTYFISDQNEKDAFLPITLFKDPFFQSMTARLHTFDGSYIESDLVRYIEYFEMDGSRLMTNSDVLPFAEAQERVIAFNQNAPKNTGATLAGTNITTPIAPLDALKHFRLVYESPTRVTSEEMLDLRYVKIFEYVPGAIIWGDGMLEIPLVTNTGRTFTYRQQSEGGVFVVPYATDADGEITAQGPYTNTVTKETYTVTNEQAMGGLVVNSKR